jgi:acetyl esterase/lipase
MHRALMAAVVMLTLVSPRLAAQEKKKKEPPKQPTPTVAKLAYGDHERQVLDFWQAKSDQPTPLVLYIHGGGWRGGDKSGLSGDAIDKYRAAGISVAAINYRYTHQADELKIVPAVKAPLEDAARALQTIRSKADAWNLDKKRIGATGGSAGACSSLWLAFHDDLAQPRSSDPIARESTRLYCAAVSGAQTSLDPKELREWIPNYKYGSHAFGFGKDNFEAFHAGRDKVLTFLKEYSPIEHVSKDDPPIFLEYPNQKTPPVLGQKETDPTHSAVMGLKLEEKLKATGVECILVYPGHTHPQYPNSAAYLIDRLRK